MSDDLRSAIEEAMGSSSSDEGGGVGDGGAAPATAAPESLVAAAEPRAAAQPTATPAGAATPVTSTPAAGPAAPAGAPEALKAPVSWKPEVREAWNALPPAAQQEVLRREREITQGLQMASDARKFQQEFQQVIAPYQAILAAENAHPLQAVSNLLQTAAALRTAPPMQRAQLVAQVVRQFGIDINMLDQALAGVVQGQPQQADPNAQYFQQQLAPVMQFMNEVRGRQQMLQQQQVQTAEQEINAFVNDPQNEFINDVREDMAQLLDNAAALGRNMSLRDAYERAIMLHPTISQVVAQRKLAQQAQGKQAAARQAQQAAVSVSGNGAPSQQEIPVGDDIRSALVASMSELQNRVR